MYLVTIYMSFAKYLFRSFAHLLIGLFGVLAIELYVFFIYLGY